MLSGTKGWNLLEGGRNCGEDLLNVEASGVDIEDVGTVSREPYPPL